METNESNVKVFGTPQPVPETPSSTVATEKVETTTAKVEAPTTEIDQETGKPKVEEKKVEAPKVEEKPKVETAKSDKTEKKPEFKVSFENEVEKKPETNTSKQETVSVTEEVVSKFLKDNYNIEVDKLTDLSKKEVLPESVAKFKKFNEETGRGINDFYNAQKEWAKESKDDTIKEFYKYQYPEMSEEDIDTRLELIKVSKDDEDELDERDLKKRKLDYNTEHSKALSFMDKKSKEFQTPLENQTVQPKKQSPEEIAETYKPYWDARDKSLSKLNEIKLNIEGVGEIKLEVTDEHRDLVSKNTETEDAFFNRWKDDKGIIQTDKSSLDTLWSIPEIRQNLISSMLEQANTLILENFSKNNRNVKLDKIAQVNENESGASVSVVGDNSKQTGKMGQPLF